MVRRYLPVALLLTTADLCALPASAEQTAAGEQPARAPRDLSGVWMLSRTQHPFEAGLLAQLPPNTAVLDDTGAPEFPIGQYGGLRPTASAAAAAAKWRPADEMTVSRVCARPTIVYATQGPFPFEIIQGSQFLVFRYEYFDLVRVIFMDGRGHPPADTPHAVTGHSIGHWEGDELVVDTTHLEAGTITNNGLNHSDAIHVVERFKLSPDRKTLLSTIWFEDPATIENNGARFIQWTTAPNDYIYPYDCDPSFGANYTKAR